MHPLSTRLTDTAMPDEAGSLGAIYSLSALTVVGFTGADSLSFLQGQLTNDIAGAAADEARLAGYCTAQGRLLGSGVFINTGLVQQDEPAVLAMIRSDIADSVIKRLSMFVLRAKVKVIKPAMTIYGISCAATRLPALNDALGMVLPVKPYDLIHSALGYFVNAPASTPNSLRWWWMTDATRTDQTTQANPMFTALLQDDSSFAWPLADLTAGLPWIEASTQDLFIPQTINLDLIGGVSFTKGCYPGQEIVARSHYRGTLKRRMTMGRINWPNAGTDRLSVNGGDDVINTRDDNQPCGRVINAVNTDDKTYLLFESPFAVMETDSLALAAYPALKIEQLALPYSISKAG